MLGSFGIVFVVITLIVGIKENFHLNKEMRANSAVFNEKKAKALGIIMTKLECDQATAEEIMRHTTVYNGKCYETYFSPLGKYENFLLFENGSIIAKF